MRKRAFFAGLILFGALFTALATPPAAKPSRGLIVGIFDEQMSLGDPDFAFPQYKRLGVRALRVNLYWGGPSGVARERRPDRAINPADPAYNWSTYDAFVKRAKENNIKVVFSILWTPRWAASAKNRAPRRSVDLKNFAYAAAKRYSGNFHPDGSETPLPAVKYWLAWNEPNNPVFLFPQFKRISKGKWRAVSPAAYAKMCNAVWSGVHLTGFAGEKVGCGVTAPRGNNSGTQPRSSLSPVFFLRGMKRAGAHFDAYAHHPYYGHPSESPRFVPKSFRTIELGNINVLIKELTHLYGRKRVWITEYGYQTKPPDRFFGVSFARQATYLAQAFAIARKNPRIDMMMWFMLKDDARIGIGWQSGFYTVGGRKKPSWNAFRRVRK